MVRLQFNFFILKSYQHNKTSKKVVSPCQDLPIRKKYKFYNCLVKKKNCTRMVFLPKDGWKSVSAYV